jgi:hypothetical protein
MPIEQILQRLQRSAIGSDPEIAKTRGGGGP